MSPTIVIHERTVSESREAERVVARMDESQFRLFYERTSRPLWAYLARMTGDRQAADDLLQEAYYRFYRAGDSHESDAHRRNSLFRIATNLVRDRARRATRRPEEPIVEESASSGVPVSSDPAPSRIAEIRTDLGRAMEQLEPAQREMLWLAYAQGASHEEIAEVCGVRAVSVRTILLRARRRLAAILTSGMRERER